MKTNNMSGGIAAAVLTIIISMITVVSIPAQIASDADELRKPSEATITIHEDQLIRLSLKTFETHELTVYNPTGLTGDLDLVALDNDYREIDRSTLILNPRERVAIDPWNIFEDAKSEQIAVIEVSVALRPVDVFAPEAFSVAAAFFSQINPLWKYDRLAPSTYTIGNSGCAMTSAAMLLAGRMTNLNPKTLNAYLSQPSIAGYSSTGILNWSKIPGFQSSSGVVYKGSSVTINGVSVSTVKSAATLKWLLDNRYYVIAKSSRYSSHFVAIWRYVNDGSRISDFEYLDPADSSYTSPPHKVGDTTASYVNPTSGIRLFK